MTALPTVPMTGEGRILGWFSWEPERPATAMMMRLLPLAAFIALALAGFAVLAMWQLGRLGQMLARSEQHVQKLEYLDALTGLPNHNHFFELLDQALAKRYGTETLALRRSISTASTRSTMRWLCRRRRGAGRDRQAAARRAAAERSDRAPRQRRVRADDYGRNADSAPFILDTVRQALGRPIFLSQ
jgi:hypothetical protein